MGRRRSYSMTIRRIAAIAAALIVAVFVASSAMLATGTLSTQLLVKINATGTTVGNLGMTADDPIALDWTQLLASGTGANQASNVFHDRRTLTASNSENLDLAGSLTNKFGTTLTFTKIKAILIKASSANTNNVLVGGAASNQFINWVSDPTDVIVVRPGGFFMIVAPDSTGYAVTAATGDLLKIANSSAGTSVTYDIIIIGVD
jgi:hypothetical protein